MIYMKVADFKKNLINFARIIMPGKLLLIMEVIKVFTTI